MDNLHRAAKLYTEKYYSDDEYPSDIKDIRQDCEMAFINGAKWANENKEKPKAVCLRYKTKRCNLCHECDVYI